MTRTRGKRTSSRRSTPKKLKRTERSLDLTESLSRAFEPTHSLTFYDLASLTAAQYRTLKAKAIASNLDGSFLLIELHPNVL